MEEKLIDRPLNSENIEEKKNNDKHMKNNNDFDNQTGLTILLGKAETIIPNPVIATTYIAKENETINIDKEDLGIDNIVFIIDAKDIPTKQDREILNDKVEITQNGISKRKSIDTETFHIQKKTLDSNGEKAETDSINGDAKNGKNSNLGNIKLDQSQTDLLSITNTKQRFSPLTRQSITAFGAIMASLGAGLTSGYSATLLPQLEQPDSPIEINTETASWIASIAALSMAPGCFIGGWMMDRFGRKKSHLIVCIPFVIGWTMIASSQGLTSMLLGRFLTGLCVGIVAPLGSVYIGEISDPKYRGFLLSGVALAVALGILLVHIIGTFVHWKMTATVCTFVPFTSYLMISFVPESPNWLLSKDKVEEAIQSFYWLRGHGDNQTAELTALLAKHEVKKNYNQEIHSFKEKILIFKKPEFFKPLLAMAVFFVTSQFSGINAVAFYSVTIMRNTIGKGLNEYVAMLIIDVVRFIASILACVLLKKYDRRSMAFISGIMTTVSLISLTIFLYATKNNQDVATKLTWLPVACLIAYICAISIGFVPLPWVMTGEVFPVALRGLGSGICTSLAFIAFFTVVKTSPAMFKNLEDGGTFLTYGIFAMVGTAILYFVLPETKGRTLQQIEERFQTGKSKIKSDTNKRV